MFKQVINCCQNSLAFRWLLKRRRLIALVAIICICFLVYQLLSLKELNGQMSDSIARVAKHMVHKYSNEHPVTTSAPEAVVDRNLVDQMKQSMDTNAKEVLNQIETNYDMNASIDGHIGQQLVSIIGVLPKFATLYAKTSDSFRCVLSGEEIPYHYLNDDYCDCVDGSDEPSTNACPHNKFYCTANSANSEQHFISSAKVNDGICDCCDGSDEYKGLSAPLKLTDSQKETIKSSNGIVATPPCVNRCLNR